jgi:hypothetical protein
MDLEFETTAGKRVGSTIYVAAGHTYLLIRRGNTGIFLK